MKKILFSICFSAIILSCSSEPKKVGPTYVGIEKKSVDTFSNSKRYILELELKQSHFVLDFSSNLKDEMNKISFEVPTDSIFYHQVTKGQKIVDEFRTGSLILNGTIGDWNVIVKDKKIINI